MEMLEAVLMRAFLMLYITFDKSRTAERRALTSLASVCTSWYLTLTGWEESPTSQWVRHQLRKLINREYFIFSIRTPGLVMSAICTFAPEIKID